MTMSNAERQALWRKRRQAELRKLREAAREATPKAPSPLRNADAEPAGYDPEREVEPEIEATLDDVKSEFADLVREVTEYLDDFMVGCRNLESECARLLNERLQTLRNADPDYDPDYDEDDPEYLAIKALHQKIETLKLALWGMWDEELPAVT